MENFILSNIFSNFLRYTFQFLKLQFPTKILALSIKKNLEALSQAGNLRGQPRARFAAGSPTSGAIGSWCDPYAGSGWQGPGVSAMFGTDHS